MPCHETKKQHRYTKEVNKSFENVENSNTLKRRQQ